MAAPVTTYWTPMTGTHMIILPAVMAPILVMARPTTTLIPARVEKSIIWVTATQLDGGMEIIGMVFCQANPGSQLCNPV